MRLHPEPTATRSQDKCLAKVHEDEPIFVLRGQDESAPDLVLIWLALNPQMPEERRREVFEISEQMRRWSPRKRAD